MLLLLSFVPGLGKGTLEGEVELVLLQPAPGQELQPGYPGETANWHSPYSLQADRLSVDSFSARPGLKAEEETLRVERASRRA